MQDELVYLTASRSSPSEQLYPNYLYFWIMSMVVEVGPNFYGFTKAINLSFHAMTALLVFWFVGRRSDWSIAFLSGLTYLLSGFIIFTSFFMPEAIYAFFVVASLILFWESVTSEKRQIIFMLFSGLAVGLSQLVKPHGLFILLMLCGWIIFARVAAPARRYTSLGVFISGFLISRMGLGIMLVGTSALEFIGSYVPDGETPSSRIAETLSSPFDFAYQWLLNIGQHFIFISFVLAPVVGYFFARKAKLQGLSLFLITLVVGISLFIAAFETYITLAGDDHLARLLARHYEFLLPLVMISVVHTRDLGPLAPKRDSFAAALALFFLTLGFVAVSLLEGLVWIGSSYSDSGITTSLTTSLGSWSFAVVGMVFIAYLSRPKVTGLGYTFLAVVSVSISAIGSTATHIDENATPLPSDISAVFVNSNYPEVSGERILVVGSDKALTEASVFQLNRPAKFKLFPDGTRIEVDEALGDFDIVVQHSGVYLDGVDEYSFYREGFAVTDLRRLAVESD